MKIVYCTFNVSVREPLTKLLEEKNVQEYQLIEEVLARPLKAMPRFNTPVWPGYNSALIMQFRDDQQANNILEVVKEFNRNAYNENEHVTACMWTLDAYFSE